MPGLPGKVAREIYAYVHKIVVSPVLVRPASTARAGAPTTPACAITPAELAAERPRGRRGRRPARSHLHPRGADGAEPLDPAEIAAAVAARALAVSGHAPVGVTTGALDRRRRRRSSASS